MVQNMTSATIVGINMTEVTKVPEDCIVFPLSTFAPWDHPEDFVSHATQQKIKEIVDVYVLTPLFIISVPLNIVNMIVFWKHGIRERINLCLFFLSLADLMVIACHFELKLDRLYATVTNAPYKLVVAKFSFNNMVHSLAGFVYVSGFMSTLIAMERCLCIVSPLKAEGMLQTKTTAVIIAAGQAIIFGGNLLVASRWKIVCLYDPLTGRSTDRHYPSQFYFDNKQIVDIFNGIVFGILLPGFFVLGVTISTTVTLIYLRQMTKWRQQSSSANTSGVSTTKDVTLTRMLIGTNVLFVVCTTPPLVFHTSLPFIPELSLSGKYYNTYYMFMNVHQLCSYMNSSFNFFVYYFFGTKFHRTIRCMFCRTSKTGEKSSDDLQLRTVESNVTKPSTN